MTLTLRAPWPAALLLLCLVPAAQACAPPYEPPPTSDFQRAQWQAGTLVVDVGLEALALDLDGRTWSNGSWAPIRPGPFGGPWVWTPHGDYALRVESGIRATCPDVNTVQGWSLRRGTDLVRLWGRVASPDDPRLFEGWAGLSGPDAVLVDLEQGVLSRIAWTDPPTVTDLLLRGIPDGARHQGSAVAGDVLWMMLQVPGSDGNQDLVAALDLTTGAAATAPAAYGSLRHVEGTRALVAGRATQEFTLEAGNVSLTAQGGPFVLWTNQGWIGDDGKTIDVHPSGRPAWTMARQEGTSLEETAVADTGEVALLYTRHLSFEDRRAAAVVVLPADLSEGTLHGWDRFREAGATEPSPTPDATPSPEAGQEEQDAGYAGGGLLLGLLAVAFVLRRTWHEVA